MDEQDSLLGVRNPVYVRAPGTGTVQAFHVTASGAEVIPSEVIIETGLLPDRVLKDAIDHSVLRGNRDGSRIVFEDKVAALASTSVGRSINSTISAKVKASNRDCVDDLTVRSPCSEDLEMEPLDPKHLPDPSAPPLPTGCTPGGYHIAEYQSAYDLGVYQPQEYKSVYE